MEDIYGMSDTELIRTFGKKFKDYRLRHNKTQQEVAKLSGLSIPTIVKFENGTSVALAFCSFVRMLRAIDELPQLENILPDLPVSPYDLLKLSNKQRRRASKNYGK